MRVSCQNDPRWGESRAVSHPRETQYPAAGPAWSHAPLCSGENDPACNIYEAGRAWHSGHCTAHLPVPPRAVALFALDTVRIKYLPQKANFSL